MARGRTLTSGTLAMDYEYESALRRVARRLTESLDYIAYNYRCECKKGYQCPRCFAAIAIEDIKKKPGGSSTYVDPEVPQV